MKVIWKFELGRDNTEISIPKRSKILTFQTQLHTPCIWVLVDPQAETEIRKFQTFGTGDKVPNSSSHIGTYQEAGGNLIWHVFEDLQS